MLKIGYFAKLGQVSVKMLRHYDDLGLLKPAQVDRFTGYRYYSVHQLPRLNRILALKDLGFALEQIARLLADDLPPAELRGMLRLKQAELQARVQDEQARLDRVAVRLRLIEQEGIMPTAEIVLKEVAPETVVSARGVVTAPSVTRIGDVCNALVAQICAVMAEAGVRQAGPALLIYDYGETETMDVEMAYIVDPATTARVPPADGPGPAVRTLPGLSQVASLLHEGPYDTLISVTYTPLGAWIEDHGYRITGPCREIYLHHDPAGAAHVVEIQFPVERT